MDIKLSHDELVLIQELVTSYRKDVRSGSVVSDMTKEEESEILEELTNKLKAALAPKVRPTADQMAVMFNDYR